MESVEARVSFWSSNPLHSDFCIEEMGENATKY